MSHSRRALESPVYSSWRLVWWPAGRRCHALRTLMAIVIPFSILSPPVGCHVGLLVISFSWVPVSARVPISTGDGWPWSSLPLRSLYVPETPSCLSLRGRKDKAAELLQWLRSLQELNTIQANVRRQKGASFSTASGAALSADSMRKTPIWRLKRLLRPC